MPERQTNGWGHFGEFFGRALFVGLGILILKQYGISEPFASVLGLTFTIGPIVTIGPVEFGLKVLLNKATVRVIGREVFYVEQRNIKAHTVIGHVHGDVIQQPAEEKADRENWTLARNFTLKGDGDTKEFRVIMKQGGHLRGRVEARGEVWAYVLTPTSRKSFNDGNGFGRLWEAEREDYAEIDFTAPRSGAYYFVVTNEVEEDGDYYKEGHDDELDDIGVKLRLRY